MPDLDDLRRLPRPTPPADGLAQVTRAARRRQRFGAAGGAAAFAFMTASVLVLGGSSSSDSLRQDTPAQGSSSSPRPVTTSAPNQIVPSTLGVVLLPGTSPEAQATADSSSPTPNSAESGAAERQAPSQTMHRGYEHGVVGGTVCGPYVSVTGGPQGYTYCGVAEANKAEHGTVELIVQACLDAANTTTSGLTFPTAQEADFSLYRDGKRVWTWSADRSFSLQSHSLVFDRGDCYEWATSWEATDTAGRPLPHGDYELRGTVVASELGDDNTWTTTLTL